MSHGSTKGGAAPCGAATGAVRPPSKGIGAAFGVPADVPPEGPSAIEPRMMRGMPASASRHGLIGWMSPSRASRAQARRRAHKGCSRVDAAR